MALLLWFAADPAALYRRGLEEYSRDRFVEAERYLREEVESNPRNFQARFLLAATLVRLDRHPAALTQLRAAHALNPRHRDAAKLLGIEAIRGGAAAEAVKALDPLVDSLPFDEETHLLLIEAQQDSAMPEAALATARKGVTRFPASAPLHCWMGLELKDSGQFVPARTHLENAVRIDPGYAVTYAVFGDLAMKEEKYEEAGRHFRTAVEKRPEDAEAHIGLSRALEKMGRASEAIQALETAAGAGPRIHLELSQLYARSGDKERARKEAELYRQLTKPAK